MDSLLFEESFNFTPRKQIKTPKRKPQPHNNLNQITISRQSSLSNPNYAQQPQFMMHEFDFNNNMIMHGGYYSHNNHHAPPYNLHPSNSLPSMSFSHHYHHQQPPSLNAVLKPVFRSLPPRQPPVSQGVVPRKIPTKQKIPLKKNNSVQFNFASKDGAKKRKDNLVGAKKEIGPDPEAIAKDLTRILLADLDDKFYESVFNLAPPASSLPLPKFLFKATVASA